MARKAGVAGDVAGDVAAGETAHVDALRASHDRVDDLLAAVAGAHAQLGALLGGQLESVEAGLAADRAAATSEHRRELGALFDARRAMEQRLVEVALAREEAEAREINDLHAADSENLARLKVKLETDVAVLEQQLEAMKFTYTLNTEKLENNFRVLTERDAENKAGLAGQKARLGRLRASLGKLHGQYSAVDARFEARNGALRDEFARVTRQQLDLAAKSRAFAAAETALTSDLVALHDDELATMAARLAAADAIIRDQVLDGGAGAGAVGQQQRADQLEQGQLRLVGPPPPSLQQQQAEQPVGRFPDPALAGQSTAGRPAVTTAAAAPPSWLDNRVDYAASPTAGAATAAAAVVVSSASMAPLDRYAALTAAADASGLTGRLQALLRALNEECGSVLWSGDMCAEVAAAQRTGGDTEDAFERSSAATLRALGCVSPLDLTPLLELCVRRGMQRFREPLPLSRQSPTGALPFAGAGTGVGVGVVTPPPTLARVVMQWMQDRRAAAAAAAASYSSSSTTSNRGYAAASGAGGSVLGSSSSSSVSYATSSTAAALLLMGKGGGGAAPPATLTARRGSQAGSLLSGGAARTLQSQSNQVQPLLQQQAAPFLGGEAGGGGDDSGGGTHLLAQCRANDALVNDAIAGWGDLHAQVVPPVRIRVWRALEEELARYADVVERRRALLEEVDSAVAANAQRKLLLAGFLYQEGSGACGLRVPPSAVLAIPPELHAELRGLAREGAAQLVPPVVEAAGVTAAPYRDVASSLAALAAQPRAGQATSAGAAGGVEGGSRPPVFRTSASGYGRDAGVTVSITSTTGARGRGAGAPFSSTLHHVGGGALGGGTCSTGASTAAPLSPAVGTAFKSLGDSTAFSGSHRGARRSSGSGESDSRGAASIAPAAAAGALDLEVAAAAATLHQPGSR